MSRRKTTNYLSNKNLLKEIHNSKNSYCEYELPVYKDYDLIVNSLEELTEEAFEQAKKNKASRLNDIEGDRLFLEGKTNKEISIIISKQGVKESDFSNEDVVFRVMVDNHIPRTNNKKGKEIRVPLNFPPFQHYVLRDGEFVSVGKSHHKDGKFCLTQGQISRKLARSYMLLAEKYSYKSNWRNYTWLDEMVGHALTRLSQVGLGFNEHVSQKPFEYFTQIVTLSFIQVLNKEKQQSKIKSNLIVESGYNPSFNDMAQHDIETHQISN